MFIALAETIRKFNIPAEPFSDLLVAFRQDQRVTRYETIDQLLEYCRYSANPVGRLVLYLGECHTPERARLSDSICTGLQLANFCQDVARDWDRGRIYLPQADCRRFGYDEACFARRECNDAFRRLLAAQVEQAEGWLRAGLPLAAKMPQGLRLPVALFAAGGLATLEAIRRQRFDVWTRRPTVSRSEKLRLLIGCWWKLHFGVVDVGRMLTIPGPTLRMCPTYSHFHDPFPRRHRSELRLLPADEPSGGLEFPRGLSACFRERNAAPWRPSTPSCVTPTTWPTRLVVQTSRAAMPWQRGGPHCEQALQGDRSVAAIAGASRAALRLRLPPSAFRLPPSSPPWPTPSAASTFPTNTSRR